MTKITGLTPHQFEKFDEYLQLMFIKTCHFVVDDEVCQDIYSVDIYHYMYKSVRLITERVLSGKQHVDILNRLQIYQNYFAEDAFIDFGHRLETIIVFDYMSEFNFSKLFEAIQDFYRNNYSFIKKKYLGHFLIQSSNVLIKLYEALTCTRLSKEQDEDMNTLIFSYANCLNINIVLREVK